MSLSEPWERHAADWTRWARAPAPALVEAARRANRSLDVTRADAAALPLEDGASDLVVSFMVLMNVDDLAGAVREAARVLEPGGRFCIAITHPINTAGEFETSEPESAFVIRESYFEAHRKDVQAECGGLTMAFVDLHRPLQDYASALEEAGFLIERIREIGDEEEPPQRESQLRWRRLPLFLHRRAVKS